MKFKVAQSERQLLQKRVYQLILLAAVLLFSNTVLALLCWYTTVHQSRTIVPLTVTAPFTVSDHQVDAAYLQEMSVFFLNTRLDVTPSSINKSHELLLNYTAPQFYHAFAHLLQKEAEVVQSEKISSTFFITELHIDAGNLSVQVSGVLRRWVGERSLGSEKKTYVIHYAYRMGRLSIQSFNNIKGETNA